MAFSVVSTCVVLVVVLGVVECLISPISMPQNLYDCLELKTETSNISVTPARTIQSLCIAKFIETTAAWSPNMTDPNIQNYIASLLRGVVREAELAGSRRHKRQVFGRPVRREVRAAPYQFNWQRYARAVRRLKTSFSIRPGVNNYDVIAGIHSGVTLGAAHNGPNFLGWHRVYLLMMEQALGTTIPYWDSSLDFAMDDPVNTILFTPRYFGNGFGFVTSGPFANLPGRSIIRNIGSDGTLISKEAIALVLSRTTHAEITEPSTAATVQYSLEAHHNGPHVWVDGTLAALNSAAYDPIFFCHHAFIDYIWELFRSRLPNPVMDYPITPLPGHAPTSIMNFGDFPFAPRIRNAAGYGFQYARLRAYEPAPRCPACANSPDLICDPSRVICISRVAPPQARAQTPAARLQSMGDAAMGGFSSASVAAAPDAVEADTPQRALNAIAQTGPLAVGQRFVSVFRDARTRGGVLPNAPADPALTRGKRSIKISNTVTKDSIFRNSPHQSHIESSKLVAPDHAYQNTFIINGKSDVGLWAFMPVKIIYLRPPGEDFGSRIIANSRIDNITDMYDPSQYTSLKGILNENNPATYKRCSSAKPGPDRVFVQSDGIDYSGRYKDFAKVDLRQPVSSSFTYVGIRKPTEEKAVKALITAYDTCGRVCRAKCLVIGSQPLTYKSCSGSIMADTQFPLMYGNTYGEAVKGLWHLWETTIQGTNDDQIPIVFLCDHDTTVPWYKTMA